MFNFKYLTLLTISFLSGGNTYKILVAFPVASKSLHHLMSSIGLALAEAGHSVMHLASFDPYVEHTNIEHLQTKDISEDLKMRDPFDASSQQEFFEWVKGIIEKIPNSLWQSPEIWDIYHRRHEFDAIITTSYANEAILPFLDGFKGSFIIVCTPGVEYNCLSFSAHWMSPAVVPDIYLPYDEFMTFFERVHNTVAMLVQRVFEHFVFTPTLRNTMKKYFPDMEYVRDYLWRNHLTLINGHYSLDSPIPLLPNQVEIGTINAKKPGPLPKDLKDFIEGSGEEGIIYFSLGSFANETQIPMKNKKILLETFRRLPHRVIWKYGGKDLDLPPNVMAKKWLPQQDILGHPKTKIFMSHCGNLGTQEAKFHGVPVLAVPVFFDQPRNAARLARKGLGVIVNWGEMSVDRLFEAVETLTKDPSYYTKMKSISKILQDQKDTPAERVVWWVEYVIRHKGAPHLEYAGKRLHFIQYIMLDVLAFWFAVILAFISATVWSCKRMWRKVLGRGKAKKE